MSNSFPHNSRMTRNIIHEDKQHVLHVYWLMREIITHIQMLFLMKW